MNLLFAIVLISSACARTSPERAALPAAAPVATLAPAPAQVASAPVESAPPAAPPDAPPPNRVEAVMLDMQRFSDRMCECRDAQCVEQLAGEMTRWAQEQDNQPAPPRLSEEEIQRATTLGERLSTCMQEAMTNGSAAP